MKTKLTLLIVLIFITSASMKAQTNVSVKSPVWFTAGNRNTNPLTNFLGSIDNKDVVFRTNNMERLRLTKSGAVGIGIANPQHKLDVNGNINVAEDSGIYIGNDRVLFTPGFYSHNIFVGEFSGNENGGFQNTAVGYVALKSVINYGNANVAVGSFALTANTEGNGNSALGWSALTTNTTGYDNSACGSAALYFNTTGYVNTAMGMFALNANVTGSENTAAGFGALATNSTGLSNTAIGYRADVNAPDLINSTAIGDSALATASNQVRIGNSNVTSIGGFANWTNISDGRVKKNIKENVPGLSFINKLKPVTYQLDLTAANKILQRVVNSKIDGKVTAMSNDNKSSQAAKEQTTYTGFIAQDVEKAAKALNYDFSGVDAAKNNKDLYGLRYAEFVVPLVKAVQELSAKNDVLEDKNKQLEQRINQLELLVNEKFPGALSQASYNLTANAVQVKISPNPVQSVLNIELAKAGTGKKTINLYDANGRLLITESAESNAELNVKQFTPGTYLVKVFDAEGRLLSTSKIIKQ